MHKYEEVLILFQSAHSTVQRAGPASRATLHTADRPQQGDQCKVPCRAGKSWYTCKTQARWESRGPQDAGQNCKAWPAVQHMRYICAWTTGKGECWV